MKFPNCNVSVIGAMRENMARNMTYFVPSHIAYEDLDREQFIKDTLGFNAYNTYHTLVNADFFSPIVGVDGNLAPMDPPDIIRVLAPDHHTAKLVDQDKAKVLTNSFTSMAFFTLLAEIKQTGYRSGEYIHDRNVFAAELDDRLVLPSGLTYQLDPLFASLVSGTCIPMMGGSFLGDFSLVMSQTTNQPSSATPFAIIPTDWVDILSLEQRDVGYEKKKAIDSSGLKPGYWYSLPAGRLGLFCGWIGDNMVFFEQLGGMGKTLADDKAEEAVKAKLNGRYYWGNVKFKKIARNSYNTEVAKYSKNFDEILQLGKKELMVSEIYPTKSAAMVAAAAAATPVTATP